MAQRVQNWIVNWFTACNFTVSRFDPYRHRSRFHNVFLNFGHRKPCRECLKVYHLKNLERNQSRIQTWVGQAKGWLILKCPFVWWHQIDQKTNEIFVRISALASKKRSNQKSALIFFWFSFFLEARAEMLVKILLVFW